MMNLAKNFSAMMQNRLGVFLKKSCNPVTSGMDADYLLIYVQAKELIFLALIFSFILLMVVEMKVKNIGL